jgi:diguanylate cyclase (GGDEF)-like protein/PAS domain S-box-containing protein
VDSSDFEGPGDPVALIAALRENTRRLAEVEQLARVGSWEWAVGPDVVTWSDQMYRIFGVKPDAFAATYEAYLGCLHPDDRALAEHNVGRALRAQEPYAADYRMVWPDGELRWAHCRGRAVLAADGTVQRLIGTAQDITDRKQLEGQLVHRALHDTLTGLPNRSLLMDRLTLAMARATRTHHHAAVLFIDLDRFKNVNDGAGHDAGDAVLREIAERLRGCVRQHDTVARYGGDEFVIVAEELHWPDEVVGLAERVLDAASQPIAYESQEITLTASIGGTVATDSGTPQAVLRDADAAMYEAKGRGGHAVAWVALSSDAG